MANTTHQQTQSKHASDVTNTNQCTFDSNDIIFEYVLCTWLSSFIP